MITYTRYPNHFEARLILADGTEAGTGYGPTEDAARYFAVQDALLSDDHHHRTAGRGHSRTFNGGRSEFRRRSR